MPGGVHLQASVLIVLTVFGALLIALVWMDYLLMRQQGLGSLVARLALLLLLGDLVYLLVVKDVRQLWDPLGYAVYSAYAGALRVAAGFESETEAKRKVVEAIDSVARKLGHTRAVCRRSYVHPTVIDAYMDGHLETALSLTMARPPSRLNADEAAVLSLLRRRTRRKVAARTQARAA